MRCHRYAQVEHQFIHAEAIRLHEILAENFAGMNGLQFLGHSALLAIIGNVHFPGVPVAPDKTNTPLVIDTNAVLALAIATQRLQTITGWRAKSLNRPAASSWRSFL